MKTIRWGMIGCGAVAEKLSGPAFQKADHSELVAVMRRTSHLAQDFAKRHRVPRWYDDADALINDPEVDAVYVATPPVAHCEYTIKAAIAGKAVYVEKPMAISFAECEKMIKVCRECGVSLYVAYYRRKLPSYIKIRQLLEDGAIGNVRYVRVQMERVVSFQEKDPQMQQRRSNPEINGISQYYDISSHTWDFLDYFLGPIVEVSGHASNCGGCIESKNLITASFRFANGIAGTGVWCFAGGSRYELNEIVGTGGKISFTRNRNDPVYLKRVGSAAVEELRFDNPEYAQQPLIESIIASLNGVGQCPSTGVSGSRTNWVMDQVIIN